MSRAEGSPAALLDAARAGSRRALGRLLSLVERGGPPADEVNALVHPLTGAAHVVGITGAPGAGKSTLTGRLAAQAAGRDRRVAVLAVDPSSPLSGGAILGDRIRMDDVVAPEGVFIRSMATRGQSGGLALAVPGAVRVLDAVGHDLVIVETVGVGQVEIEIAEAADTTVVVVTPGWGDAVQANKAGLLEVADVFVVNKADRPGAADARRDLDLMLDLTGLTHHGERRPPVLLTTATTGDGVAEVLDAVLAHLAFLTDTGGLRDRRRHRVRAELHDRIVHGLTVAANRRIADAPELVERMTDREISPVTAADELLRELLGSARPDPQS